MGIDRDHLRITGKHEAITDPHFLVEEDAASHVTIVVTQAFGPDGDNLVGISDVTFDEHPAITVKIKLPTGTEGLVHLSPIHGDDRKQGFINIPSGTKCQLLCPVSGKHLDKVPEVEGDEDTDYFAIYLTPAMSMGDMVAISDVWGHYHSRIVDHFELISTWIDDEEGA